MAILETILPILDYAIQILKNLFKVVISSLFNFPEQIIIVSTSVLLLASLLALKFPIKNFLLEIKINIFKFLFLSFGHPLTLALIFSWAGPIGRYFKKASISGYHLYGGLIIALLISVIIYILLLFTQFCFFSAINSRVNEQKFLSVKFSFWGMFLAVLGFFNSLLVLGSFITLIGLLVFGNILGPLFFMLTCLFFLKFIFDTWKLLSIKAPELPIGL